MKSFKLLCLLSVATVVGQAQAAPLDFWDDEGWNLVADDEGVGRSGYVNPGWGGQDFDAEYLFYRLDGDTLLLGLQTGFNVDSGKVTTGGRDYYAGDLAIDFDGGDYDYAIDFGLATRDYDGDIVEADSDGDGVDAAGLYAVSDWNNDIYFNQSSPYAMDAGTIVSELLSNNTGYVSSADSYFRTVSIDLNSLGLGGASFDLSMHWTMSCGNDALDTDIIHVSVPEPKTLVLLAVGIFGLMMRRKVQEVS